MFLIIGSNLLILKIYFHEAQKQTVTDSLIIRVCQLTLVITTYSIGEWHSLQIIQLRPAETQCLLQKKKKTFFFLVPGDLYSLFVDRADSRHCQNGAFCTAPLPTSQNNDVHNRFHSHLHCFHTVPQHITPVHILPSRLWKDGKIFFYDFQSNLFTNMGFINRNPFDGQDTVYWAGYWVG